MDPLSHAHGAWLKERLYAEVNFIFPPFFPSPSLGCCPRIGSCEWVWGKVGGGSRKTFGKKDSA